MLHTRGTAKLSCKIISPCITVPRTLSSKHRLFFSNVLDRAKKERSVDEDSYNESLVRVEDKMEFLKISFEQKHQNREFHFPFYFNSGEMSNGFLRQKKVTFRSQDISVTPGRRCKQE